MAEKEQIIIDAENAVLGRLASFVAKQALQGKEIVIVNAEKAIIVGKEKSILENYKMRKALGRGHGRGPFFPTQSERIMKRTIRNMLPYKQTRGRQALKKIKCYKGIPKEFENKKMIKSGKGKRGMRLEKISKLLGGK